MKMRPGDGGKISSFKTVRRPHARKHGRHSGFNFLSAQSRPKSGHLRLEDLQALTPYHGGVDLVTQASRDLLINCIQMRPVVHRLFFEDVARDMRLEKEDLGEFPIDRLAVCLVAEAISRCNDIYKFSCTIEKNNLSNLLQKVYSSVHWKKLGFTLYTKLYPSVVRDPTSGVSLQDFIDDDGSVWAEQILNSLTDPAWTMNWLQKIVRGLVTEDEYNKEMNTLFVKLHLLDPQSVIPAYHFLIHQRALPECALELATRNYLGGPLDCTRLVDHVTAAILKETFPLNMSKLSLNEIDTFCGVAVEEFILTEVREITAWNGRRPDNKKKSTLKERCLVM